MNVVLDSAIQHRIPQFSHYAKEATGEAYTSYAYKSSCNTDEPGDHRLEGTFCHRVVLPNPGTSAADVDDPRITNAAKALAR